MKPHELTQGTPDGMLGPRITVRRLGPPGLLPIEDVLDEGECAFCGHRGSYPEVFRTVLKSAPHRVSRRCADVVACLRRWFARKAVA